MAAEANTDSRYAVVDFALAAWRQGDCVLGECCFAHCFDPRLPVTEAGKEIAPTDADLVEGQLLGLVVVTQTCDLVRSCVERPYIEVCPLVEVDDADLQQIKRGRRPQYGYVPLDQTMTVTFWFVRRDEDIDFLGESRAIFLENWLKLVPKGGASSRCRARSRPSRT